MGWYADTDWDITFTSEEALEACAVELRAAFAPWLETQGRVAGEGFDHPVAREAIRSALLEFNEEGEIEFDDESPLRVHGLGWGKAHDIGLAEDKYGLGIYAILARHCTGTVDWDAGSSNDGMWRVRFADGDWEVYGGEITYPGDPGEAK